VYSQYGNAAKIYAPRKIETVLGKLDIAARYMPGTGREERKTITAAMRRRTQKNQMGRPKRK
jgi:hypothetical protein